MSEPQATGGAPPAPPARGPVAAGPAGKLSPDEERQLGELMERQRAAAKAGGTVFLKVEAPHESFEFGGRKVGNEFTEVPLEAGIRIMNAAVTAGVKITQRES